MSFIRKAGGLLLAAAMSIVLIGAPAQAHVDSDEEAIASAIQAASRGDTTDLADLLDGPLREETQRQLRSWLEDRGELDTPSRVEGSEPPLDEQRVGPASGEAVTASATTRCGGKYECFCTGYNGVSMGWYGEIVLACHGYLDQYISGNHVSHTIPDLFPVNGGTISLGCLYATGSAISSVVALPYTLGASTYGWAVWGSGAIFSGAGLSLSCG